MAENDSSNAGGFTQAQVDSMVANAVHRAKQEFADYDDLKAKVAAAEAKEREQQTQMEQLTGKVTEMTEALAKRDHDALRRQVADAAKLTPQQAKFLTGKTEAELQASVAEVREAFGVAEQPAGEGEGADQGGHAAGAGSGAGAPQLPPANGHQRRPADNVTAGGQPAGDGAPVEMDPGKLADMIGTR